MATEHKRDELEDLLRIQREAIAFTRDGKLTQAAAFLGHAIQRLIDLQEWIDARRQDKLEEQSQ